MNIVEQLLGRTQPKKHRVMLLYPDFGKWVMASSEDSLNEFLDEVDTNVLEDMLTEEEMLQLPTHSGLYTCDLYLSYYQSNHPSDPIEWTSRIELKNIVKIHDLIP